MKCPYCKNIMHPIEKAGRLTWYFCTALIGSVTLKRCGSTGTRES